MCKYDINSFYRNMRRILDERDISSKEVYTVIGMAQANFSNAYNQKRGKRFSIEQMLAIAEFLGCSLDDMFTSDRSNSGEQVIRIPDMSNWTCADLLKIIFSFRKSECGLQFTNIKEKCKPFHDEVDVTAIYFPKRFNLHKVITYSGSNYEMLINTVLREWSQIIESTTNLDASTKEYILSTWESRKIEQMRYVELSDSGKAYTISQGTGRYVVVQDD